MAALTLVPVRILGHVMRWCSTTTWGSARWQRGLAAAVAAVIFWPQASVDAVVGLDSSWQAGLALARVHDLAWGPEIVLTYGPLGFLQNTAYYSFDQSLLATIYQPIIVAALFLGIAAALRQRHAPITSLIGAFITTGIAVILYTGHGWGPGLEYPELAVLAAFAWVNRTPVAAGFQALDGVHYVHRARRGRRASAAGEVQHRPHHRGHRAGRVGVARLESCRAPLRNGDRVLGVHPHLVGARRPTTGEPARLDQVQRRRGIGLQRGDGLSPFFLPVCPACRPRGRVEPCLDRGALRDVRAWRPGDSPALRGARRPRDRDHRPERARAM